MSSFLSECMDRFHVEESAEYFHIGMWIFLQNWVLFSGNCSQNIGYNIKNIKILNCLWTVYFTPPLSFKNRNSDLIYKTSFTCWKKITKNKKTSNFSVWFFKMAPLKLFPPRPLYSFIFAECLNLPVFVVLMSDQFVFRLPLNHIC